MKKLLMIGILAAIPCLSFAETEDMGLWLGVGVEKKVAKKWTVEAEGEYRLTDNMQTTDRLSLGFSTAYKLTKWLKANVGYEYLHSREPGEYSDGGYYYKSAYWCPRHRANASLTASLKLSKHLRLSLRERWAYTYRPSFDRNRMNVDKTSTMYGVVSSKEVKGNGSNVLRNRLQLDYKSKKNPFSPYMAVEMYSSMGGEDGSFGAVEKMRYSLGMEYELSKQHSLKVFYLFQDYRRGDDGEGKKDAHVIGVNYGFSF